MSSRTAAAMGLFGAALSVGCGESPTDAERIGRPAALQVITGSTQTGGANQFLPEPLTLQVLDAAGHGVPGVGVAWTLLAGDGALFAQAFPTVTDSTGLVFVLWELGNSLGDQRVAARCCDLPSVIFTARSTLPLAQRLTVIGGMGQQDTVGTALAEPLVVRVRLADGTPAAGARVAWRAISPGSSYSPADARTDSQGLASTIWTLGTVAGVETTAVVVDGLPPALAFASALPGAPARVTFAPDTLPVFGVVDDSFQVSAHASDQYGNPTGTRVPLSAVDSAIATVIDWRGSDYVVTRRHGATWIKGTLGEASDSLLITVLGFSGVSDGGDHVCGLSLAGDAYCWGENYNGSVGDGTTIDRPRPVRIGQGLGLQVPYTEWHTCALDTGGRAYCWGLNQDGQVGNGSPDYATDLRQTSPVAVAGDHLYAHIRAGRSHTCAVTTSGDAYCWGANYTGQLGRDTLTGTCYMGGTRCSNWPILVAGGLQFANVSASSWEHSCGVTTTGAAYCWGSNASSQLGTDSTSDMCGLYPPQPCSYDPLPVQGGIVFKSVKAGGYFTCGVSMSGDGYCWGYGDTGALGNGANITSSMPVKVAGGLLFADVQAGRWNACGLTTAGSVYCWGGSYGSTPVPVLSNLQFASLAVGGGGGSGHTCALTADNDLYCWWSGAH